MSLFQMGDDDDDDDDDEWEEKEESGDGIQKCKSCDAPLQMTESSSNCSLCQMFNSPTRLVHFNDPIDVLPTIEEYRAFMNRRKRITGASPSLSLHTPDVDSIFTEFGRENSGDWCLQEKNMGKVSLEVIAKNLLKDHLSTLSSDELEEYHDLISDNEDEEVDVNSLLDLFFPIESLEKMQSDIDDGKYLNVNWKQLLSLLMVSVSPFPNDSDKPWMKRRIPVLWRSSTNGPKKPMKWPPLVEWLRLNGYHKQDKDVPDYVPERDILGSIYSVPYFSGPGRKFRHERRPGVWYDKVNWELVTSKENPQIPKWLNDWSDYEVVGDNFEMSEWALETVFFIDRGLLYLKCRNSDTWKLECIDNDPILWANLLSWYYTPEYIPTRRDFDMLRWCLRDCSHKAVESMHGHHKLRALIENHGQERVRVTHNSILVQGTSGEYYGIYPTQSKKMQWFRVVPVEFNKGEWFPVSPNVYRRYFEKGVVCELSLDAQRKLLPLESKAIPCNIRQKVLGLRYYNTFTFLIQEYLDDLTSYETDELLKDYLTLTVKAFDGNNRDYT